MTAKALPLIILEHCGACGRVQHGVLPEGTAEDYECASCGKMEARAVCAPLVTMN